MVWKEAEDLQKTKTPLILSVLDANKGGLVFGMERGARLFTDIPIEIQSLSRVQDGNKDKIEEELKKLKGEKLKVTIIASDQKKTSLFSRKKTAIWKK